MTNTNAAAVITALQNNAGQYIDDHNPARGLNKAPWFGIYKHNGVEDAFVGYSDSLFCINRCYLDEQGVVHLSDWSVGGNVRTDLHDVRMAVAKYNEACKKSIFNHEQLITKFYFSRNPMTEEVAMNTTTAIAMLETKMRAVITEPVEGGRVISFHPRAIEQMDDMASLIKSFVDYADDKVSLEDLEVAENYLQFFDKRAITGEIVDNVLQPLSEEHFEAAKTQILGIKDIYAMGVVVPVALLQRIIKDVNTFMLPQVA